jgi:hypothetical protein
MANTSMHATIGMAIAKIIPIPFISIPLAFLSHFIVDLYPEWYNKDNKIDTKEKIMGVIQILLMLFVAFVLFHEKSWVLWAGAIAANLVDLWEAIYGLFKKGKGFWFCHPDGWFPFKVNAWQEFGMRAMQTASLDAVFNSIILILIMMVK